VGNVIWLFRTSYSGGRGIAVAIELREGGKIAIVNKRFIYLLTYDLLGVNKPAIMSLNSE
jgi:hypothetical protein